MCGIFGFSELNDNTRQLIPVLALKMVERGRDSWGCTNGLELYKTTGNIVNTFNKVFEKWEDSQEGVIFHTRGASAGSAITAENAHPHRFATTVENNDEYMIVKFITGIHNGYISNHTELKKKYTDRSWFDVDTKHVFKHIADGLDTKEIRGVGVLAWYETLIKTNKADNKMTVLSNDLKFVRFNSTNLYIVKLTTGEFVFASTEDAVFTACKLSGLQIECFYPTKENIVYSIGLDEDNIPAFLELGKMEFSAREVYNYENFTKGGYQSGSVGNAATYIATNSYPNRSFLKVKDTIEKCPCCESKIDPEKEALCITCFDMWINGKLCISKQVFQ